MDAIKFDNYVQHLNKFELDYLNKLEEMKIISNKIGTFLGQLYSDEELKKFKDFDEFLEEINSIFEYNGSAKLIFINKVKNFYNKNGKTF